MLVAETWRAMHTIYAAPVFETPLEPAPWLAEQAPEVSGGRRGSVHLKLENKQAVRVSAETFEVIEKALGVPGTTRGWDTILKVLEKLAG